MNQLFYLGRTVVVMNKKENYFILETFDEEINMRVQFHYWTSGKYFYSSTELEDGTTARKQRISEKE